MRSTNLVRRGLGVAMVLGLSSCTMLDMQRSEQVTAPYHPVSSPQQPQPQPQQATPIKSQTATQKTSASKNIVQKTAPGPTRKAAPQIPIIE